MLWCGVLVTLFHLLWLIFLTHFVRVLFLLILFGLHTFTLARFRFVWRHCFVFTSSFLIQSISHRAPLAYPRAYPPFLQIIFSDTITIFVNILYFFCRYHALKNHVLLDCLFLFLSLFCFSPWTSHGLDKYTCL